MLCLADWPIYMDVNMSAVKPTKDKLKSLRESIDKLSDLLLLQSSRGDTKAARITKKVLDRMERELQKTKGRS
jgi:hypothetical protein